MKEKNLGIKLNAKKRDMKLNMHRYQAKMVDLRPETCLELEMSGGELFKNKFLVIQGFQRFSEERF